MKKLLLSSPKDISLLIIRILVGTLMINHGYPKFLKVMQGNLEFADPIGMGPEISLILAAFAEFICSILIILGLTTRFALIPLIVTMGVAFFVVLGGEPFGAKELPFVYMIIYIALLISGPGKFSFDNIVFKNNRYSPLFLAA